MDANDFDIKDLASLVGAITGPLGLAVALSVYLRDTPKLVVSLMFDRNGSDVNAGSNVVVVSVSNIGRRPIYFGRVHIRIPNRAKTVLILDQNSKGTSIPEGAPPVHFTEDQIHLSDYRGMWWKLRASVIDASGRYHHSDWPTTQPQWSQVKAPIGRLMWNRILNWFRQPVI